MATISMRVASGTGWYFLVLLVAASMNDFRPDKYDEEEDDNLHSKNLPAI